MRPIEFEILLSLATGTRHGYAIIQDIEQRSDGALTVETGTLYRAMQRLVEEGYVTPTEPRRAPAGPDEERRRYYAITAEGRRAAAAEAQRMASLVDRARTARLIPGRS
jgi:DNA-binding PadR family transcriptional regulator